MSMESKINGDHKPTQEKKEVKVEDVEFFGHKLRETRGTISVKEMAYKLNSKTSNIHAWEDGRVFPAEDKLPDIAQAYNLDLNELQEALKISKEARKLEKSARKTPKFTSNSDLDTKVYWPPKPDKTD